jgi:hypothetical protein
MDLLQPDASPSATVLKPRQKMAPSNRALEYCAGFAVAVLGLAASPFAIRLLTGRPELGFRPLLLSAIFSLFLLLVAASLLARQRARRFCFHLLAWTVPFVVLAALETIAGAVHLSDHVALFQDLSVIKRGNDWGPGNLHLAPETDGFAVYRPWSGNGVTINELGLRTPSPTPRSPSEHRIAVVGSSETFGTRLADADTIPALLQAALHRTGHGEMSVYNLGVEDANLTKGLALLRHFKPVYDIDQVVFMTGGGDAFAEYLAVEGQVLGLAQAGNPVASFELYKAVQRIRATWFEPSPARLAQFDARNQARSAAKDDRLVDGIVAAKDYCNAIAVRCDFVLQPLIGTRRSLVGSEVQLAQTYRRLYPGFVVLAAQLYRDALNLGLTGRVHDLTKVFDNSSEQYYFDGGHVNEAGNLAIADALVPIVLHAASAPK